MTRWGRPVPSLRAVALFALGLLPAVLSIPFAPWGAWPFLLDLAVLLACAVDFLRAPRASLLEWERQVEGTLSSGEWNPVVLTVHAAAGTRTVRGEVRDVLPAWLEVEGHRQPFALGPARPAATLRYRVYPPTRGDLTFTSVYARLAGPWGLCARQERVPLPGAAKVYPDLRALHREALALARADEAQANRVVRRPAEGTEFESLREYRAGDDYRTLDWKATARRARMMVRVYQPERNQSVLLMLDCGRQMAGKMFGRRKLDFAVDAALRLAKVGLDKGDAVGVVAFSTRVQVHLPPRKGAEHLRALTHALYRIEATLEESDFGAALDVAMARLHKRTLVVVFTDVQSPDASAALVSRTLALRPRHLPLLVSVLDEDLERAAAQVPLSVQAAYERQVAQRLSSELTLTTTRLLDAGALSLRASAPRLSAAAVNEYLRVKARGLL